MGPDGGGGGGKAVGDRWWGAGSGGISQSSLPPTPAAPLLGPSIPARLSSPGRGAVCSSPPSGLFSPNPSSIGPPPGTVHSPAAAVGSQWGGGSGADTVGGVKQLAPCPLPPNTLPSTADPPVFFHPVACPSYACSPISVLSPTPCNFGGSSFSWVQELGHGVGLCSVPRLESKQNMMCWIKI